mmetsp:Transcript_117595/g.230736  ORF Transcript_117595/g.230736 Transcript_117595/m.230736 type:complete len:206 (+) Transcript_117595:226-843(+)
MLEQIVQVPLAVVLPHLGEVVQVGVGVDAEEAPVQSLHLPQEVLREGRTVPGQDRALRQQFVRGVDELRHVLVSRQGPGDGLARAEPIVDHVAAGAHARASLGCADLFQDGHQEDHLLEDVYCLAGDPLVPRNVPRHPQALAERIVAQRRLRLQVHSELAGVARRPDALAEGGGGIDGGVLGPASSPSGEVLSHIQGRRGRAVAS